MIWQVKSLYDRQSKSLTFATYRGRPARSLRKSNAEPPMSSCCAASPVATVTPIDVESCEDFVLANAPVFVASREDADRDLTRGESVSLSEFLTGKLSAE